MSNLPDKRIAEFIDQHHVLTLATSKDGIPYVANCFYVFDEKNHSFIFTTSTETKHGNDMISNSKVAASIVLETKTVGKIQGLQIQGKARLLENQESKNAKKVYLKKYPYAILKMETMWELKVDFYKLTDNKLGFGKKIIWHNE